LLLAIASTMFAARKTVKGPLSQSAQKRKGGNAVTIILVVTSALLGGLVWLQVSFFTPDASLSSTAGNRGTVKTAQKSSLAGLSCEAYGGPSDAAANEMVYWKDIPSDAHYKSPYYDPKQEKFLTFEPDNGGWNNIR
jgi:hypothetical protein